MYARFHLKLNSNEFTVLCGIVLVVEGTGPKTICITTGTKCCSDNSTIGTGDGSILSDSHAEVLARRAFVRYLMKCIWACLIDPKFDQSLSCPIQITSNQMFVVKKSHQFWLYVSDSPCGDASIYRKSYEQMAFTGAKPLTENREWVREDEQALGILRTKSGRSDIKPNCRSTSMSCSDKICLWNYVGLQGALLSRFIPSASLTGLIVSEDPDADPPSQLAALRRALWHREQSSILSGETDVWSQLFAVELAVTKLQFEQSKSVVDRACRLAAVSSQPVRTSDDGAKRKRGTCSDGFTKRPSGTSTNWILDVHTDVDALDQTGCRIRRCSGGTLEQTQALTGLLLGAAKSCRPRRDADCPITTDKVQVGASRLSRRELSKFFQRLQEKASQSSVSETQGWVSADDCSYQQRKQLSAEYQTRKQRFLSIAPFFNWQRSSAADETPTARVAGS